MIFNDFSGGISDSILRGIKGSFATMVGLDIHSTPGILKVNQKMTKNSGYIVTELVKFTVTASDGNTYLFSGESGKIWKKTSADVYTLVATNAKGACIGALEYNGYIYYVGAGFVGRQSVAAAASEASWSSHDDDWQTLSKADAGFAPMAEMGNVLYIGNGSYIASFDGSTYQDAALDLPTQYRVSALFDNNVELIIGTYVGASSSVKVNYCKIFKWDGSADSWNGSDVLYEAGVNAFIPADNQIFIQAGIYGSIYYYDGDIMIPFKKIPGTFTPTRYGIVYNNAACVYNSLPMFGFSNSQDAANSTGNPTNLGIYSLGRNSKNYPIVLNLEYPLSMTTPMSSTEIGSLFSIGNDLYATWRKKATITMTIADPCVVTYNSHGLSNGASIIFTTTGALPTGITAGTTYYIRTIDTNTFHLYDTAAHAIDTGATTGRVVTTGTQSGVHTGAMSGVDKIDYTAKYASAYVETLVVNNGDISKKAVKFLAGYKLMPTNCAVTLSHSKNYATSYTDLTNAITDTHHVITYKDINVDEVRALQMKLSFTVSSNNSPEIDYFGFEI